MVRGVEKRAIFLDDRDREFLVERVAERVTEDDARCYAWAFMPNHVHLVLRTGAQSISKLMQRLYTSYALRFNRRYGRVGHLVQNRFKSRLVLDEEYLLPLIRYVHRNPLEAGLVRSVGELARYPWSGHGALMGRRAAVFEAVDEVLAFFDPNSSVARKRIDAWMRRDQEPGPEGESLCKPPQTSRSAAPRTTARAPRQRSAPARSQAPTLDALIRAVCGSLDVRVEELLGVRRDRRTARARSLIAYRATCQLGVPGVEVARALRVSPSAIVQAAARGRVAARPGAPGATS